MRCQTGGLTGLPASPWAHLLDSDQFTKLKTNLALKSHFVVVSFSRFEVAAV